MAQSPLPRGTGTPEGHLSTSREVFRNDYFTVLVDERMRIVRTIRSDKPYTSLEEVEAAIMELCATLDGLGRARYSLLSDTRAVPGRNDPQFEAALQRLRPLWLAGFRRVGVLVKSAVGLLQVQRYARQDGMKRLISTDEDELLKYLTEED
jgi:hypothetical protein